MQDDVGRFLIGHRRPEFRSWPRWRFVTAAPEEDSDFVIGPPPPAESPDDRLIGEYHFLFALARRLRESRPVKSVRIAQYRRLVVNRPYGEPAPNQPWSHMVDAQCAERLDMEALTTPNEQGFLISPVIPVGNVAAQFALHHPVRDFFRFLADLVDGNVLSNQQASEVALLNVLIPAPSNGVFPLQSFLDINDVLERAALCFFTRGYVPYDDYQRRIIGFCLERLNSYLLIAELLRHGVAPERATGHQLTVSAESHVVATI